MKTIYSHQPLRKVAGVLLSVLLYSMAHCQKEDRMWVCVGRDPVAIDFSDLLAPKLFEVNSIVENKEWGGISGLSIASKDGTLLFYAFMNYEGESYRMDILNKQNQVIEGSPLKGYLDSENNLVLPFSNDTNKFHLFSLVYEESDLNYHILDMSANDGKGKLLKKDSTILSLSGPPYLSSLTAVKHTNGRDWWLLGHERPGNRFYRFLLRDDAITGPEYQIIGSDLWNDLRTSNGWHLIDISDKGDKLAIMGAHGIAEVYDFDRTSGLLDAPIYFGWPKLTKWINDILVTDYISGITFSSDSRYIYLATKDTLQQYDLYAHDIAKSKQAIYINDTGISYNYYMRKGPDDKIYLARLSNSLSQSDTHATYLGVINNPNKAGKASNYQYLGFDLKGKASWGSLTYMPPLHMPALTFDQVPHLTQPDTTCPGDSVRLSLAPAYDHVAYQWSPLDGLDDPASIHAHAAPIVTTTYTLTTTASAESFWGAQSRTDTVRVVVRPPGTGTCKAVGPPLAFRNLITRPTTQGLDNGQIRIAAYGGQPPYQYSIDDGPTWQSEKVFGNLAAGTYSVAVKDAEGVVIKNQTLVRSW